MLAEAASHAGFRPLVIDLYADLDMQDYAEAFRKIPSLGEADLAPAVDFFIEHYGVTQVIYGSGFEYCPQSLHYLGRRLQILGNDPDTFISLQNKSAFFSVLDRLKIPYPAVLFTAPYCTEPWLVKPMQGLGGMGIRRYHKNDAELASVYWQRFQAGTPYSVLFLANGQRVQVIGFNTQWSVSLGAGAEFVFSGIINQCDLTDAYKKRLALWLGKMVLVFGLKGLNSLDFIQYGDCTYVLEINPRPPASMQLHGNDLLARHIQVCLESADGSPGLDNKKIGCSVESAPACATVTLPASVLPAGYQIVYAEQNIIIPDQCAWPEGCVDLPNPGDMCRTGEPICSIIAHAKKTQLVLDQLLIKQQIIVNTLSKGDYPHGIHGQRE
jgi:uncharacterized protein